MTTTVQKWGNSLGLRIPHALAQGIDLRQGSEVALSIVEGSLMIKPKGRRKASLAQMLKGVTRKNRHGELLADAPVGKEVW